MENSNWKEYKFEEIMTITSSKRIFYEEYVQSGVPFYRSKEIIDLFNRREIQTELFISEKRFDEIKNKFGVPRKDDILLTSVGSLGIPYLVKESDRFYFKDGNLTWLKDIDSNILHPVFIYKWITSQIGRQKLEEISIGSTQAALTISALKSIDIQLPPLPEQKAIASVLSSLDDKIDLLHQQNQTLEALAETLFRQWFIERCPEPVEGEAKEDWPIYKFKDIVKHVKPGTNFQPKRVNNGIPFLNVKNLNNGFIDLQNNTFITQEEYERVHKNWKPEVGDVLISRIGTLGLVATILERDLPIAVHYNMINLKPKLIGTEFLYFFLKSNHFQEEYFSRARQSVQEYLAIEDVEEIEVKLPLEFESFTLKEQQFIEFYNKIKNNFIQIQTLTQLRDTLLPKLMSGEVRVKV